MRRFIALVLCIALCFGLFAFPAFAVAPLNDRIYNICGDIWEWLDTPLFETSHPHGGGRDTSIFGGGGRYDNYVNDMRTEVGTTVISNNGIRVYLPIYNFASGSCTITNQALGNPTTIIGNGSTDTWIWCRIQGFEYPFSCTAKAGYEVISHNNSHLVLRYNITPTVFTAGTKIGETEFIRVYVDSTGLFGSQFRIYMDLIPTSGVLPTYNADISPSNRMTTILSAVYNFNSTSTKNQYYLGTVENNMVTNVYNTNIFNETTNVFTLPGDTPTTYNITNWNYDYSTRTYNCTDGTNNYVVTYGDDHITVTVPDGSGGTTSTIYYYVHQTPVPTPAVPGGDTTFPGPSSDNYEDDPNTTGGFFSTVWKAFKDGLASLIAGIINGLFKGIKALIDGITSVFSGLVSGFLGFVTSFFGSFGTGPGAVGEFFGGGVVDLG